MHMHTAVIPVVSFNASCHRLSRIVSMYVYGSQTGVDCCCKVTSSPLKFPLRPEKNYGRLGHCESAIKLRIRLNRVICTQCCCLFFWQDVMLKNKKELIEELQLWENYLEKVRIFYFRFRRYTSKFSTISFINCNVTKLIKIAAFNSFLIHSPLRLNQPVDLCPQFIDIN